MKSIVSYPDRGKYGNPKWRGNCSGHIIRDYFMQFRPKVWADVFLGGGTSQDVHEALLAEGIDNTFFGLDLHSGFNVLKDSFSQRLNGLMADWVWLHPPYDSIIHYSGEVWGKVPHPDDLSRCASYEEFVEKMRLALLNVWEGIARKGRYTVLVGDVRKKGVYRWLSRDISMIAPGRLESIVIKFQHNCVSDSRFYSGDFIPIQHETAVTMIKDGLLVSVLDQTLETSSRLKMLSDANWKAIIGWTLNKLGGEASLSDIYASIITTRPGRRRSGGYRRRSRLFIER
jgi:hypothetical protein